MSVESPLPSAPLEGAPMANGAAGFTGAPAKGMGSSASFLSSKPTLVVNQPLRFLIMDAPRQGNLHLYIKECKKHHVTDIVRVCEERTYHDTDLRNAGIKLHEMAYDDGTSPPQDVLDRWITLVRDTFYPQNGGSGGGSGNGASAAPTPSSDSSSSHTKTIAVHCVAGLGRAPVLVAIALIEFAHYDPVEAVSFIRKYRRGAINEKQLNYLEQYTRQKGGGCGCVIT